MSAEIAHGLVGPLVIGGLPWLKTALAGTFLGGLTPALLSAAGFSVARFSLGAVEGGHFPGAIKTVGQWHPKSERVLSTGIFNSGSNVGAIVATLSVPFLVGYMGWGWASAFYLTGTLSLIWLAAWLLLYDRPERHRRVSAAESPTSAAIRPIPPSPSPG